MLPILVNVIRLLVLCGFLLGAVSAQDRDADARRPNILFAMADDWGWPHAGVLGDEVVATPTFDRIAREGVLFEHAYVSSPSCTPSRNAVLTGQHFFRLGQGANLHSTLDVKIPTFMALLAADGYDIAHWRKAWGPGKFQAGGYRQNPCGPNRKFGEFLQQRDKDKPFCFWFGTSDPHRGYKRDSGRDSGIDPSAIKVPAFWPDDDVVRRDIADYYFEVQRWDRDVGLALEQLEQAGELDSTIVVMTGDHGMPFPRCKGNLYDYGARVPLAIRWGKRIGPARTITKLVSLTDMAPTFLQAAAVSVPSTMTGSSLLPMLTGAGADWREFLVFGRERHTPAQALPSLDGYPARAIRNDRWLLIRNFEPDRWPMGVPTGATHPMNVHADTDNGPTKSHIIATGGEPYRLCFAKRPAIELYDCDADPDQVHNLADLPEYRLRVEMLTRQLTNHLRATKDPRLTAASVAFDSYPYRTNYLKKRLEQHARQRK